MSVRTILWTSLICIVLAGCRKSDEIDSALQNARAAGKSLMVEFGADWCSDCQEMTRQLQRAPLNTCLRQRISLVHVDVGQFNRNLDKANALGIDIRNGVIPTAVFFPAIGRRTTKVGTHDILSFLEQSCSTTSN